MSQRTLSGDFAAGTEKYNTPLEWVQPLADAVGGFDLDPCASTDSDLATVNVRNTGGLSAPWTEFVADVVDDPSEAWVWCNHPYGRGEPPRVAVPCVLDAV
ncbi:hypothetical protein [Halobaculum lipolyticum]|uniref:hypothetical protein n=1 Tax=Halobaculum lipolyticum TaxID=3032001 RepID=UPI0024C3E869|nr:hypothetical protein [Halobaculum sp. DT31]